MNVFLKRVRREFEQSPLGASAATLTFVTTPFVQWIWASTRDGVEYASATNRIFAVFCAIAAYFFVTFVSGKIVRGRPIIASGTLVVGSIFCAAIIDAALSSIKFDQAQIVDLMGANFVTSLGSYFCFCIFFFESVGTGLIFKTEAPDDREQAAMMIGFVALFIGCIGHVAILMNSGFRVALFG